jgi:hypothetical protein
MQQNKKPILIIVAGKQKHIAGKTCGDIALCFVYGRPEETGCK